MDDARWSPAMRLVFIGACLVVLVAGMREAAGVVVLLLMALFLAVITTPLFVALCRRGVPIWAALLVMIIGLGVVGTAVTILLHQALKGLTKDLDVYQVQLQQQVDLAVVWLTARDVRVSPEVIKNLFDPQAALQYAGTIIRAVTGLLGQSFLVFLLIVFIWLEAAILPGKVQHVVSADTWRRLGRAVEDVRTYVALKTVMSLLTGLVAGLWCLALGIPYAVLWALLAFVLNYVPTIGSIVAAVPPIVLALMGYGLGWGVLTAVGYGVLNIGISNGIEPRFMGRGLGLSPLVVVLAMVIWGWILGPVGMVLALPLTVTVKIALEAHEDTRWIAVLLGAETSEEAVTRVVSRRVGTPR